MSGEPAESIWRRAVALHERGHLTAAIALAEKAVREVPRPARWQVLGNWRGEAGDTEGAEKAYRSLLDLDPIWARAHVGLGHLKNDAGDLAGAEADFRAALELEETGLTHEFLGAVLAHQGRDEDAIRHFERSIEMDDTNGEAFLTLARRIEEPDHDRSVQLLKKARSGGRTSESRPRAAGALRQSQSAAGRNALNGTRTATFGSTSLPAQGPVGQPSHRPRSKRAG